MPTTWQRPDGRPVDSGQIALDQSACRGVVERAAIQGQSKSTIGSIFGVDNQDLTAYNGCMAEHGYLPAK